MGSAGDNCGWLDAVSFTPGEAPEKPPLGDALDAPDLTWTTGGDANWSVDIQNGVTDGNSARSDSLSSSESTWIETTVKGAGTLSFDWKANIQNFFSSQGSLEISIDGATSSDESYRKITATTDWAHETFDLGEGEHTLRWTYSAKMSDKPENGGWLDNVTFASAQPPEPPQPTLGEALDAPDLTWTTGGDDDWTVEDGNGVGGSCARSGDAYCGCDGSWIETTVTGPGTLSFAWNVSSGYDEGEDLNDPWYSDFLRFTIDGETQKNIAGEDFTWTTESFAIGEGEHTLRWHYLEAGGNYAGEDCGWLDHVVFTPETVPEPTTLKEALDAPNLEWATTGASEWTIDTENGVKGGGCARSGPLDYLYDQSDLMTSVTGPGTLTFWWNVSCSEWDGFYLAIDGDDEIDIAGTDHTWEEQTVEITPGTHQLTWYFIRMNYDEPEGEDCGWLDSVSYTQKIVTTFTANTTAGDAPLAVQFTDQSTGNPTTWLWDFGDGTTSDEQHPAHTFEAGVYDISLTVTRDGVEETGTKTEYIHSIGEVTLTEAFDAPDLEWTTGGNATWSIVKGPEYVGYSAGKSAGALTCSQNSWVKTTVAGPCTLSFDWNVNPGKYMGMPLGKMEFAVDDADQYDDLYKKIQFSPWRHETYHIGHGTHTVTWTYSTSMTDAEENGGWLDNVTYTYGGGEPVADFVTNVTEDRGMAPLAVQFADNSTGFPTAWSWDFGDGSAPVTTESAAHVYTDPGEYPVTLTVTNIVGKDADGKDVLGTDKVTKTVKVVEAISLGTAADAPKITWTTGGDAEWFTDLYCALKGGSSARSGVISSAENTSWIEATVTGPGVLTFNWNINSSATTYSGLLKFSANGVPVSEIKGTHDGKDWPGVYYEVPPGEQTFRWTYSNEYRYKENDCGHLDNVTYTYGAILPTAAFEANVTRAMVPATVQFNDTSAGCPTTWSWDFGDGATSDKQHPTHTYEEVGEYPVILTVTNDAGTSTTTQTISTVPFATLPEAVEAPDFEWSTGGDVPWFVDVDCVHTGTTSARSGAIEGNQESWFQANITGPGYLTFAWNVSSEPRHDYLRFFIDGEEEKNIFGFPENWTEEKYRLGFGTHAVRWVYEKDYNSNMMEDCGWVDNVTFTTIDDTDFVGNVTWGEVPLTVDFTGYSTGNPTHWAWDFGDKESAVGRNQTHTYTTPGVYNVTLIVQKDTAPEGQMEVKNSYITVTPTFEDALDAADLVWTTGGDAPWFVQLNESFVGGSCGQSGAIDERNQQTWIETTVTGPKNLTFDWQVSSYKGYSMKYSDALVFSIDGEVQNEIAGTGDGWQTAEYTLERGEHTLRWMYEKRSYSSTAGEDCGWLDNVTLTNIAPVISFSPAPATVAAGTEREVAIVADHLPDGLKNYSITVTLGNDRAQITDVDFASLTGTSSPSGLTGTTVTFSATDDGNTVEAGAEDVVLVTLKVKGLTDGMVGIEASDVVIYTDSGEETSVICTPGTIDVVGLSPFPGCVNIPGDGDGDGLFEDVNGDGTLDADDVTTYFEHFESIFSQKNPRVFDYNGNGRIDFDDLVTVHRSMETDTA